MAPGPDLSLVESPLVKELLRALRADRASAVRSVHAALVLDEARRRHDGEDARDSVIHLAMTAEAVAESLASPPVGLPPMIQASPPIRRPRRPRRP
jgi:hypothetical protein